MIYTDVYCSHFLSFRLARCTDFAFISELLHANLNAYGCHVGSLQARHAVLGAHGPAAQ